ncbi:hypothetical protein Aph02nite_79160 [Actinoplanes philippinensis]|uniref:Uncharacterized protein n=1 Tax=Actinoplanes philippinensis TaxID=35752 RepID=A0A1I2KDC4_9ACTN|nr:hypothetical protein Aph02nite_79160 [Actinoplanes philippinensis]SFF65055.1 hypothetical protein SAMN05421541_116144 [Actinoplanes philippinensis]
MAASVGLYASVEGPDLGASGNGPSRNRIAAARSAARAHVLRRDAFRVSRKRIASRSLPAGWHWRRSNNRQQQARLLRLPLPTEPGGDQPHDYVIVHRPFTAAERRVASHRPRPPLVVTVDGVSQSRVRLFRTVGSDRLTASGLNISGYR